MTHFLPVQLQPPWDVSPSSSLPNCPVPSTSMLGSKVSCSQEAEERGGGAGRVGNGLSLTTSSWLDGGMQGAATCGRNRERARLAAFIPIENQDLLRSLPGPLLHARHPFPQPGNPHPPVRESVGRLRSNMENCLGNKALGKEGRNEMFIINFKFCKKYADTERREVNAQRF